MYTQTEKQRLRVAENLDNLRQDYCRANLILWAVGHKDFQEVFVERGKTSKICETNYCGKCE